MKNSAKTGSLRATLVLAVLAACGCGAGGGSSVPSAPAVPAPAALSIYSSNVEFGDVAVGSSATQGVTFANSGGLPLTLVQNSVSGPDFTTTGIGAGVTLNPGQYVTLAVNFVPSAAGKTSGSASVTSTTSAAAIAIPFSGNGIVPTHSAILGWNPSKSVVIGYNIYRTPAASSSWARLNSSPILTTSYTDWDVQGGDTYLFAVTSVSTSNVESQFSDVTATTVESQ